MIWGSFFYAARHSVGSLLASYEDKKSFRAAKFLKLHVWIWGRCSNFVKKRNPQPHEFFVWFTNLFGTRKDWLRPIFDFAHQRGLYFLLVFFLLRLLSRVKVYITQIAQKTMIYINIRIRYYEPAGRWR